LEADPNDWEAAQELGVCMEALGRLREAKHSYEQALEHRPNSNELHFRLGTVLQREGLLADAKREYGRCIDCGTATAEQLLQVGHCERALGNLPAAVERYRQAIAKDPNVPEPHFWL